MAEQDAKAGFSLPWMNITALVVAIAGGISVLVDPIVSSRPAIKPNRVPAAAATQNVDARLWQDPLRTASDHADQSSDEARKKVAVQTSTAVSELRKRIDGYARREKGAEGKLLIVPMLVAGGPYAELGSVGSPGRSLSDPKVSASSIERMLAKLA